VGIGILRRGVGVRVDGTEPPPVPVIVLPVFKASVFVVFPSAATDVWDVNCIDDCLSASTFTVHVPTIPAPLNGIGGLAARVTAIAPLVCVSGTRMTGNRLAGLKLIIWIAVDRRKDGLYGRNGINLCIHGDSTVNVSPTFSVFVGRVPSIVPLLEALERMSRMIQRYESYSQPAHQYERDKHIHERRTAGMRYLFLGRYWLGCLL
jgi:hypothetical protein